MNYSRSIIKILLLLALILSSSSIRVFAQDNKTTSIYVPKYAEQSVNQLSKFLTSNAKSDYKKAKNIYDWITNNFILEERYKSKSYTLQQVLKRKRGTFV